MHWLHILSFLSCLLLTTQQQTKSNQDIPKPLVFEFEKEDPQRVKIYWDPSVDVKKIKEISNRDVHYVINNTTGRVREEYSPWLALVTEQDDVDPARRLFFIKSDMCIEQDYRVSWYDSNGVLHENVTQRMEPSPEPWKPTAKIEVTNLRYDGATKHIVGSLSWAVSDEKLRGIPKLGALHPAVRLESCRIVFDKPVPLPVVDPATKVVSFHPLYAKHGCTFTARLRQMTYNGELECRSLRQTVEEQSDKIELNCQGNLNYPECKETDSEQPCAMTCDQQISVSADFDWGRGWPKPYAKVEWKPRNGSPKPVVSHLVRYAQVDTTYNNYPIEEFNVTFLDVNANKSSIKLEPFSKDTESFYTFQVCTLYEACFATAKWSSVPKYPVYATDITDKAPIPTITPPLDNNNGTDTNSTGIGTRRQRSPIEKSTPPPRGPEGRETTQPSNAPIPNMDFLLIMSLILLALFIN